MKLNQLGIGEPLESFFQEVTFIFVQCKTNLAQSSFNLTLLCQTQHQVKTNLLYLSSSNPNEVLHFALKKLILKSKSDILFFLKILERLFYQQ